MTTPFKHRPNRFEIQQVKSEGLGNQTFNGPEMCLPQCMLSSPFSNSPYVHDFR